MDEPRSAQRYLEDLTPGGSEYFDNPQRCYEWAMGRIEAGQRIALDAALQRNRLHEENKRLKEQLRIATEALESINSDDAYYPAAMAEDALNRIVAVE